MSLRDRIRATDEPTPGSRREIHARFGVLVNPFPSSSQTTNNPHFRTSLDDEIDAKIESFIHDHRTQVVVVEGTQGTGKTNILNFYESEITEALSERSGFYLIRYLADPEASFEGTVRRLFLELGVGHLVKLGKALQREHDAAIGLARSVELRAALQNLKRSPTTDVAESFLEWLLGGRLLKLHRLSLGVNFRLDTVEAKTAALRDLIIVSSRANTLKGVFLLLDELEKQDGVLSAAAVVRYLSALRAIIDALPNHLFMMLAVTPDALRRYSVALPAFRSRLQDRIEIHPLQTQSEALALANFYIEHSEQEALREKGVKPKKARRIVSDKEISSLFNEQLALALRNKDTGLRQRSFLHSLHVLAEQHIREE